VFVTKRDRFVGVMLCRSRNILCESIEYAVLKITKDFEEKLPIKPRQIVTDNDVFRAGQFIKKKYEEKGYLLAEVKAERVESKVPGNIILKFVVKDGPKVQIKNLTFKGNKAIKEKKLKSKFKTKETGWRAAIMRRTSIASISIP
jgi:outer membrane protein assembly factor BamA